VTLLLDTHVFLWMISEPAKLSARAMKMMQSEENELAISTTSLWEIAIKVQAGKLDVSVGREYFETYMNDSGVQRILPVTPSHVYSLLKLPRVHRDPFDRMLAAQSIAEGMPLVSADPIFRKYPVELVW
jgi:PIN domain nuclease of toxin-antitoxin system